MDLFKFTPITSPTVLEQGQMINGYTSVMWTERYAVPGEFEIKAKLSSDLADFLPIGTLISHIDTYSVMVVENLEIQDEKDQDPDITITGRCLTSFLENRVVGMNQAKTTSVVTPLILPSNPVPVQISVLINQHIRDTVDAEDIVINVEGGYDYTLPGSGILEVREIKRGNLLTRVQELLAVDNLGLKSVRRNTFGLEGNAFNTQLIAYDGIDRSDTVIFSWRSGDIEGADYLFSNKKYKNAAVVTSRYYNRVVEVPGFDEYERRYIHVDASDIDGSYSSAPADIPGQVSWLNRLRIRGEEAISSQNLLNITRTDIGDVSRYEYRKDFGLGDLVTLDGNYGAIAVMRVTEFVEIQDENGESSHPTLEPPGV